ncbi:MAG: hypothetical protein KDC32_27995, partial [Saprospiraceae bacterium]|nr:hypothetical protein [Saprospiraceae bacterium]
FRWVVKSWTGSSATEVSRQNLQDVLTALNDRSNPVMTLEMIEKFLDTNYDLRIHTISSQADCPNPTVFPVHPDLQLEMETSLRTSAGTTPSTQTVSFSTFSTCSREGYLDHLNAYFQEPAGSSVPSANGAKASLAAFIFQDYFNLIAKHMVQEALSSLKNFSHLLGSADSLQTILGHYQALNSQLTLDDLSLNNQFHLLREGVELPLTSEVHVVGAGETLHSVAQTLGLSLADLAGEVQNVEGLFNTAADPYFQLLDLEWSNIEELVADLANNRASVNLSGMIARYYLGGLRLPVLGDLALTDSSLLAGADYGLYRLTGQQFALPEIPTTTGVSLDEYRVKMQGGPAWLHFGTPDAQGNHPALISYSYAGQ